MPTPDRDRGQQHRNDRDRDPIGGGRIGEGERRGSRGERNRRDRQRNQLQPQRCHRRKLFDAPLSQPCVLHAAGNQGLTACRLRWAKIVPGHAQTRRMVAGPRSCLRRISTAPQFRAAAGSSLGSAVEIRTIDELRMVGAEPSARLDPAHLGHVDVDQDEVGLDRFRGRQCLRGRRDLPDRLEPRRAGDHLVGHLEEGFVVVDRQNPYRVGAGRTSGIHHREDPVR